MAANAQWLVACGDPFGRHRGMAVYTHGADVVVVSPPGQSAVLSPHQTRELDRILCLAEAGLTTRPGSDGDTQAILG